MSARYYEHEAKIEKMLSGYTKENWKTLVNILNQHGSLIRDMGITTVRDCITYIEEIVQELLYLYENMKLVNEEDLMIEMEHELSFIKY